MLNRLKTKFLDNNKLAKKIFFYLCSNCNTWLPYFFDKLVTIIFEYNEYEQEEPLAFAILFIIFTAVILYFIINHMQKVIKNIDRAYRELKRKDKIRLAPYEFALNNSGDAIYWFTLDARIVYVNNAACNMLGYTKDEMLDMFFRRDGSKL